MRRIDQKIKDNAEKKKLFIRALAEFFVENQAIKSIDLALGKPYAKEWAKLRNLTPMMGWGTVKEAEQILTKFLM